MIVSVFVVFLEDPALWSVAAVLAAGLVWLGLFIDGAVD